MVKIKRDRHFVWPDRYYIWTYYPPEYRKSIKTPSLSKLYQKHYTRIPFFTRAHAKHIACYYHGVRALRTIHIIKGDRLIKQGITTFNASLRCAKDLRYRMFIQKKDGTYYPGSLRQWAYPPEYRMDAHRRRKYIIIMNNAFEKKGRKGFNEKYKFYNYDNHYRRISNKWLDRQHQVNRRKIYMEIILEDLIARLEGTPHSKLEAFTIIKCIKNLYLKTLKTEVIEITSIKRLKTLLEDVKQFNNELSNKRKGLHCTIYSKDPESPINIY